MKQEIADRIHAHGKLGAEVAALERTISMLRVDLAGSEQRASHGASAAVRELEQAHWRISALESECRELNAQMAYLRASQTHRDSQSSYSTQRFDMALPPPVYRAADWPGSSSSSGGGVGHHMDSSTYRSSSDGYYNSDVKHPSNTIHSMHNGSGSGSDGLRRPVMDSVRGDSSNSRDFVERNGAPTAPRQPDQTHQPYSSNSSAAGWGRPEDPGARRSGVNETGADGRSFGGGGSLANVLGSKKAAAVVERSANTQAARGGRNVLPDAASPFATEHTSAELESQYHDLDRRLTSLMTEKGALLEESER